LKESFLGVLEKVLEEIALFLVLFWNEIAKVSEELASRLQEVQVEEIQYRELD